MSEGPVLMEGLTMEDLTNEHKKERKDLQAKIMQLKKSVPKGDKKRQKEMQTQVTVMEKEFEEKCQKIISEFEALQLSKQAPIENGGNAEESKEANQKVSKAEKRREKKRLQEIELKQRLKEQQKENIQMPRAIEMKKLNEKLKDENLRIHEIAADGNCLFSSISHQLHQYKVSIATAEVRRSAAKHLRENREDFESFVCDDFNTYCDKIEKDQSCWGGQIELRALSIELKCRITVYQAEGPNIEFGDEGGPHLRISYHRHLISSGEHYNSVISRADSSSSEDDEE